MCLVENVFVVKVYNFLFENVSDIVYFVVRFAIVVH